MRRVRSAIRMGARLARSGGLVLLLAGLAASCGGNGRDDDGLLPIPRTVRAADVLARVGGVPITREDVDRRLETVPSFARARFETPEGRRELLDAMIQELVLLRAALDAGYLEDPEIRRAVRRAEEQVLQNEFFRREIRENPGVAEDAIRAYYEANRATFAEARRWNARHIVLTSRADAEEVLRLLAEGTDFADVARERSDDLFTKASGGDLGWVEEGGIIPSLGRNPEFEEAVLGLAVGERSDILETARGFHVVELLGVEEGSVRPLEEVREEIAAMLLVPDVDVERFYRENESKYSIPASLRLYHVLLATREAAERARARLAAGEPWSRVAAEMSIDPASRSEGGDLGTVMLGGVIRGFGRLEAVEAAAFALAEGEISAPVASEAGWHVLRVEAVRPAVVRPLEEVRDPIRRQLYRERKQELELAAFERLRAEVGVEVLEDRL